MNQQPLPLWRKAILALIVLLSVAFYGYVIAVAGLPTIWQTLFGLLFFLTSAAIASVILYLKDSRGRFTIAMALCLMTWIAVFFAVVIPLAGWLTAR